jgi:predicted DNA-binding antitoxin AbrB/MazE fold protein
MTISVRVIVENGKLRLLEPLDLAEGQELEVTIVTEGERAAAALDDLLVEVGASLDDSPLDDAELMREIAEGFRGQRPLSETIIEERREGP